MFLLLLSSATLLLTINSRLQIKQVKRSVKKMLAEGNIDYSKTVIFSAEEISNAFWVEPREFRLDGMMFDIFKTDTINGKLFYHCFEDEHENAWVELLLKFSESETPFSSAKNGKQNPLKYLMKDYFLNSGLLAVGSWQNGKNSISERIDFPLSSLFTSGVFNPPEAV